MKYKPVLFIISAVILFGLLWTGWTRQDDVDDLSSSITSPAVAVEVPSSPLSSAANTTLHRNILCLGDSLTAGSVNGDNARHPYGDRLRELVSPHQFQVEIDGVPGCTTEQMLSRMQQRFDQHTLQEVGIVIILGGTNDAFMHVDVDVIVQHQQQLYALAKQANVEHVLFLTVPEHGPDVRPAFNDLTLQINQRLRNFVDKQISDENSSNTTNTMTKNGSPSSSSLCGPSSSSLSLFDLRAAMPFSGLSDDKRKKLWSDGVHFTPVGYQIIAGEIVQCLQHLNWL